MAADYILEDLDLIRKIDRKIYDTDKAQLISRKASGCYGDAGGYEEMLYQKKTGEYFMFGQGGSASPYPEARIVPLTLDEARDWLTDVVGADSANQICQPAKPRSGQRRVAYSSEPSAPSRNH